MTQPLRNKQKLNRKIHLPQMREISWIMDWHVGLNSFVGIELILRNDFMGVARPWVAIGFFGP